MMDKTSSLPADDLISCFNESTNDCVKVLDTEATLLSFNQSGYDIMEIENASDVIGKDWLSFWQGEAEQHAKAAFQRALEGKLGYFEGPCPTLKGTLKWWQVTIVPLKNSHNDIEWILAMSRDITELHTLREENVRLRAAII